MFAFLFYMVHEWFMYLIFGCTYILLMVLAVLLVPRESWSKTEADNDYGLVDEEGSASNQTSLMPDRRGSDVLRFFLSVPYLFLLFFSVVLLCKNTLEWEEFHTLLNSTKSISSTASSFDLFVLVIPAVVFICLVPVGLLDDVFKVQGRNVIALLALLLSAVSSVGFLQTQPRAGVATFCIICLAISTSLTLGTILSLASTLNYSYFGLTFSLIGLFSGILYLPVIYVVAMVSTSSLYWLHVALLIACCLLAVFPLVLLVKRCEIHCVMP
eukprot:TRINITY_DN4035_c0_g1_i8.p1 TRINITY_DN4035_c0_g1~~TRINITY_DN4035_c0_g1_i8.p1  ORF type:complete len:270 (-),score=56.04 TRINITY_DN4035_c0_g1_i8:96-905(-)